MTKKIKINENNIQEVITVLDNGGIIAIMTDTVYGIAGNAHNQSVIQKIFDIKQRNTTKKIPILTNDIESAFSLIKIQSQFWKIVEKFWPGGLTIVGTDITDNNNTLAVRVPNKSDVSLLLHHYGSLAASSANISGSNIFQSAAKIAEAFHNQLDLICINDNNSLNIPSTIIDCTGSEIKLLREGIIKWEDILLLL